MRRDNGRKGVVDMNFYEIDTVRGTVYQLSKFFCGVAPCGGKVVFAANHSEAQELWFRYRDGEYDLKGTVFVKGQDYPYRNIICEKRHHMVESNN